jgi:DNA primase
MHALCPFHPDTNPSFAINLEGGGFFCFSCGEKGGDVVDFVMKRYGMSFKAAALSLGAWDESNKIGLRQIREARKRRDELDLAKAATIVQERRRRIAARDWLHFLERLYDEDTARLSELRQGAREQFPGEEEACWEFLAWALPEIRKTAEEYQSLSGLQP